MNIVQSISKREKGLRFTEHYDIALFRLKCYDEDVYNGIEPNVNAPDFNAQPPTLACRFSSTPGFEETIAFANEDGKIAIQNTAIRKKCDTPLEGTLAHSDAIFDIAWMPQEMKLITASGDHTARLWDVSTSNFTQLQIFRAHTRSIKSTVFRPQDKAVFATGARDGAIMIWDIRANYTDQPKPDNAIYNAHCTDLASRSRQRSRVPSHITGQSITGLVFQDDYTLLSCSTGDGLIKVWDLRKNYSTHKKDPIPKHLMNYAGKRNSKGFTSLLICPAGITLYASCMDNTIYAYNVSSYSSKPIAEYFGHKNRTFYIRACLSPDGKYLASGSSDELAFIWHTDKPGNPILKLSGHREEVSCIAWCNVGDIKIVTCSDDSCHRIWRVGKEHISESEKINIRGFAEAVIPPIVNQKNAISILETTPTMSKPRPTREYSSESDVTPDVNTPNLNLTQDAHSNIGSVKRNYEQMLTNYWPGSHKSILSPIEENLDAPAKRPHTESKGARRLFSPGSNKQETNRNNEVEVHSNNGYASEEPGPSSIGKLDRLTPFSPTSNLPNFVVDGTAPHLLEMSPQKLKENVDWLTKMRKERYAKRNCKSTEKPSSPKTHTTPVRRMSRSKSTESHKTPKSPLLQFFRPAIKDCNNDLRLESTNRKTSCFSPEGN